MHDTDAAAPGREVAKPLYFSFAILAIPVTAQLAASGPAIGSLWFLGLVPVALGAYGGGWRGTATSLVVVVGAFLLTLLVPGALGRPMEAAGMWVLPALLGSSVAIGWLSETLRRERDVMGDLALTDRLTGLPNRRHARVFLETMFGGAERGRLISVVLFDIDDLTSLNEKHGRKTGDEALARFAGILSGHTRRMNLSARFGGEEFVSILSGADEEGARAFGDRVREAFRLHRFNGASLTVSAGVATYHPSMRVPDELVAAADLALYRAKSEGKDRVRVFGMDSSRGTGSTPRLATGDPSADGSSSPAPADYPRTGDELGRSSPPDDLLPHGDARYGQERRVLIVEHDGEVRAMVSSFLAREGFQTEEAPDSASALQALSREFDIVITDLSLPGLTGSELVKAVKSRWPATQVVAVAGASDAEIAAEALGAGADRYLFKPLVMPGLQSQVVDALARRDRVLAEQMERRQLSGEALERSGEARRVIMDGLFELARAVEVREPYTRGHHQRMADYAEAILKAVGPAADDVDPETFRLACLVHDIGKLEVPDSILNKNGPLSPEEFARVRRHPGVGRRILEPVLGDELFLAVAGWHHERWDGSGYPDGLAGEAIPLAARVAAVADALDAMTSSRPYRAGLTWEDAVGQVRDRSGTHFDPGLLPAFEAALPRLRRVYGEEQTLAPDG